MRLLALVLLVLGLLAPSAQAQLTNPSPITKVVAGHHVFVHGTNPENTTNCFGFSYLEWEEIKGFPNGTFKTTDGYGRIRTGTLSPPYHDDFRWGTLRLSPPAGSHWYELGGTWKAGGDPCDGSQWEAGASAGWPNPFELTFTRVAAAPFKVTKWPGDSGTYRAETLFNEATSNGQAPFKYEWDWGDDSSVDEGKFEFHTYKKPGTYTITHTVTDFDGLQWRSTYKQVVAPPTLGVSLSWDEDDLEAGRFPIDRAVDVKVTMSASCEGVGYLKNVLFTGGAVLTATSTDGGDVELGQVPLPDAGADLAPCTKRSIIVPVTGKKHGKVALKAAVSAVDEAGKAQTRNTSRGIAVGHDLLVKVEPDPTSLKLDIEDGKPKPKPFKVKVTVKNVSGEGLKEVGLDMQARNRVPQQSDTRGYDWVSLVDPNGGDPIPLTPDEDPETIQLGDIADKAEVVRTLNANAIDKSILRITGIARGVSAAATPRAVSGNSYGTVLVDQPKVISVDGGPLPPKRLMAPGEIWRYDPVIENLSPTEPVMVRVLTTLEGNVGGRPVTDSEAPGEIPIGDIKILDPKERWLLGSEFAAVTEGGTTGKVKLEINAWEAPYNTDSAIDPDRFDIAENALSHKVTVDERVVDNSIPFAWSHAGELAWMFTKNFVDSSLRTLAGTVQMLNIPRHFARGSVALYYGISKVWNHMTKEEISALIDDIAREMVLFSPGKTLSDMKASVDAKAQALMTAPAEAFDGRDASAFVSASGELLGAVAADALTGQVGKLAWTKLVKSGKAAAIIERRAAQQAASLARRTEGLGVIGRAGLLAGDLLDLALAKKLYGIDEVLDAKLLEYCKRNKLVIAMRDRGPGSIQRLAQGMLPKIEKVKAKNVNSIDIDWLGFDETHRDIAMIKDVEDWDKLYPKIQHLPLEEQLMVSERWQTRRKEWTGPIGKELRAAHEAGQIGVPTGEWGVNPTDNGLKYSQNVWRKTGFDLTDVEDVEVAGKKLRPTKDGLKALVPRVGGKGAKGSGLWPLTGDMDPIAIVDENMQLLSMERRLQVYKDLGKMGFQHPESLTWNNEAGRRKYLWDFDLANKKAQALLAYTASGERRAVYFSSTKSNWQLNGAVGDLSRRGRAALASPVPRAVGSAGDMGGGLFMLDGAPMSWDQPIVPITPYDGDITQEASTDDHTYWSPAGKDGAQFTDDPSAPDLRANPDDSLSEFVPQGPHGGSTARAARREAGSWRAFTRPAGVLRLRTQSGVSDDTAAGATTLPIFGLDQLELGNADQKWFAAGQTLILDPGGSAEETVKVAAAGDRSLTLTAPLAREHRAGELIILDRPTATAQPTVVPTVVPTKTPTPGVKPVDKTKPKLAKLKLTRKAFTVRVSEAARVKVTITRKQGKRYKKAVAFTLKLKKAGVAKRKLKLKKGRYKITVTATDAAGNKGVLRKLARLSGR